ncbi:MAG: CDP-alcohol phosphatidyltransferase family protein [bacterium]
MLTLLKPVHALVVVYFILNNHNYWASGVLMWLMVVDMFDGWLFNISALSSNQKLKLFRRIFNTTGDYVSVQTVLIIMINFLDFPIYLYSIELIREIVLLVILFSGWISKKQLPLGANLMARIAIFSVGLMAIAWLIYPELAKWCLIPIIIFGLIGTKKHYLTTKAGAE